MTPFEALVLLIWVAAAAAAGAVIGARKGRRGTGIMLGLVFGWIGVIVIACIPPTHETLVQRERERLRVQREAQEKPY
jgi:hypothetical protein